MEEDNGGATKKLELVPDICNNIKLQKCNRKPGENSSSFFPYDRFQYYLNCLNEIERVQRSEAVLRGEDVSPLEYYNDDHLMEEFSKIYGGLDKNSPNFIKIFDNYKEQRLEEISEWIQDENYIKQHRDQGREVSLKMTSPDIHRIFTTEEIKLFESVEMGPSSGHDWFILPRKALTTQEIASLKTKKTLNLALFDPELSDYTDYTGTRVIPPQAISREDRGISEKLSLNIYEIMCRHPAGITYNDFSLEYHRKFNYKPNFQGLGYKTFVEFLVDLNHVVFTQSSGPNNTYMMYPTYLENLISPPMDTFWRIYHKLIVILQLFDGVCKTDALVQFFHDLYHIKLPLTSWGFLNADEFVVYLINNVKWRNDFYKVEKVSLLDDKDDAVNQHYVIHMTPTRERAIRDKRNSLSHVKTTVPNDFRVASSSQIPVIPKQFAQVDDYIPSESDYVTRNMEDIYVVVFFITPNDFEIVRKQTWESMKGDRKLSDHYTKLSKTPGGLQPANPKTLRPGLLLVVYDSEHFDYVRAKYVRVASKFHWHQVQLLDVGGHLEVHQDKIYYMYKNVMKDMKAQGIRAGLWDMVKSPIKNQSSDEYKWHSDILKYAYQLMVPEDKSPRLRVQFIQRNNGGKWLVSMKFGPKNKLQDVGQKIIQFANRFEPPAHQKVLKAPENMDPSAAILSNPVLEQTDFLPPSSSETDVTTSEDLPVPTTTFETSSCSTDAVDETTTSNGNTKISSSGMEWRSSGTNVDTTTSQKKQSYQPRSYASTAASSAWRSQPNETRNFGAEANAFPTLAESVNAHTQKNVPNKRTTSGGAPAQPSSFSYANIASSKNAKQ